VYLIAASRFEGGSWVRIGFLLTYTAFAYGCVVVGAAVVRVPSFWRPQIRNAGRRDARTRWRWGASFAAVAAVAALAMPAIRFPTETLSGFEGLDLLSVLIVLALALVLVAGGFTSTFDSLRPPAAVCLAGVLGGNLLIQRFTTRGTSVEYGLWWATGMAGVAVIASLGVRGRQEERR
jgi:hypothetical protein